MVNNNKDLAEALQRPFTEDEVKFKPQTAKGNRALAVAYIDARLVAARLDEVFGPGGWESGVVVMPSGGVLCTIRVVIDGNWVKREDFGAPSDQKDPNDRLKAAVSDGLKRAAVQFGIGRYLYGIDCGWWDYDPQSRQFRVKPTLPGARRQQQRPAQKPQQAEAREMPKTGRELHDRLKDYDAKLAAQGMIQPGALLEHVARSCELAGFGSQMYNYSQAAIELATAETKKFSEELQPQQGAKA
jgi:hypothetical protein